MNPITRRGFVGVALSACCTPWASGSMLARSAANVSPAEAGDSVDPETARFWQQLGTKTLDLKALNNASSLTKLLQPAKGKPTGETPPQPPPPPPDFVRASCDETRLPMFFYLADPADSSTWQPAYKTKRDKLLDAEDVRVDLVVNTIKLSQTDNQVFGKIVNGSLRVDLGQTQPLSQLVENLVWSSLGAVFPKADGVLPQVSQLAFNPGTTFGNVQTVPLPGGGGTILWQFFVEKQPSGLTKIVDFFKENGQKLGYVAPLLGLPGIAISAFTAFNNFISKIPHVPNWLFQQCDVLAMVATRSAFDNNLHDTYLPLADGHYIVVPAGHVEALQEAVKEGEYAYVQGRIVPKDKADDWNTAGVAEVAIPEVTYVTMRVKVTPIKKTS